MEDLETSDVGTARFRLTLSSECFYFIPVSPIILSIIPHDENSIWNRSTEQQQLSPVSDRVG